MNTPVLDYDFGLLIIYLYFPNKHLFQSLFFKKYLLFLKKGMKGWKNPRNVRNKYIKQNNFISPLHQKWP